VDDHRKGDNKDKFLSKYMSMKKRVLIASIIFSVVFILSIFSREIGMCPPYSYSTCSDFSESLAMLFFPILPLFFFSLVTYFMREEIFQSWWRFARVWVPLSMIAILLAPAYASDWMFPIDKGRIAFFTAVVFVIISLILIVREKLRLRK